MRLRCDWSHGGRMRICHVVYQYYPTSPRTRRAAESFAHLGHEVHVISARGRGQPSHERISGVDVHRFPLPVVRGGRMRYLFQYATFLLGSSLMLLGLHLDRSFDIVQVHSLPDFQVVSAAFEKARGSRVILDMHEAMPELFAARFGLRMTAWTVRVVEAVETISCMLSNHILVVNDTLRERLLRRGVPDAKVTTIMNAPPRESPRTLNTGANGLRIELAGREAIVYVGGVNAERDLETLIRAVALLRLSHPLKLVVIGHGEDRYRGEIAKLAAREGLDDIVVRSEVPHDQALSYMSLSDIGPVTYQRNPLTELALPTKALEYAAAGKPLVIANLGAVRRIFGDAALYYAPGNADDLATQIARLLDDPVLRRGLVDKASAVLASCSWETMLGRLEKVYVQRCAGAT